MKLLQINSVCGIRSTGRICADIATSFCQGENECKIAYGRLNVPDAYASMAHKIGCNVGVLSHMARAVLFDRSGDYSRRATRHFLRWVQDYDPDVIHLHNLHGFYLNIGLLTDYLKACQKPIVWTLHDCWSFTGHCAYFDGVGCEKWKTECHHCSQTKQYPRALHDRSKENYLHRKACFSTLPNLHIVTPSHWLADRVRESFLAQHPIHVIPNGIDTEVFSQKKEQAAQLRARYGLQDKRVLLGVASVWEARKGFADFIALSSKLDDTYRMVLIGLSKKQIRTLPKNVIGITHTQDTAELAAWYSAADLFLNLTYEDNYPTVNLEAQACGTPVLTYRTGGSPESVLPFGVTPQGNLDLVCEKIREFGVPSATDRAFLVARAAQFDRAVMARSYCELYEKIK